MKSTGGRAVQNYFLTPTFTPNLTLLLCKPGVAHNLNQLFIAFELTPSNHWLPFYAALSQGESWGAKISQEISTGVRRSNSYYIMLYSALF